MADESLHIPSDQNLDYHIVTLFERLEAIRKDNTGFGRNRNNLSSTIMQPKKSMHAEIRTLEFWRSIIAECLASFFYVFIVCGAAAGAGVGASVSSVLLATALASGFAIATLTQCFMHISGAHINPAVTLATCTIRAITPLRAAMYITAQCGGGIAGAALLYGVTVPGYQGNLQAAIAHSSALAAWERFGVEFILTFIVVLAYFVSMDSYKKYLGNASLAIGAAYSACSFVSMPYLNPARSLGPSFVLNKWDHHWVYWFGPMVGGAVSAIVYEYIFNSRRNMKKTKDNLENDSSSIHSEDDLNYDLDLEKPSSMQNPKFQGSTYRQPTGTLTQQAGYCQNFYTTTPMSKIEPSEPLYGGTRSLYCRSPPMPRANLNRSQSVYAKSNTAINRGGDVVPRPGPLVPAQSLYPMRLAQTQNSHLQNQNLQNQMQQRTESIYGIRGSTRQSSGAGGGGGGGGSGSGGAGGVSQHQQQQPHPHHQQQQQQQHQQQSQQPHSDNIGFQPVYGTRHNPTPHDGSVKFETRCNTLINSGSTSVDDSVLKYSTRSTRPESMYGTNGQRPRGQSAQSDDSSYGSYHGSAITPPSRNPSQTGGGVGGVGGAAAVAGNMGEIIMYAPPSAQTVGNMGHQQQQQQQQMRTCERKISSSGNGNCQTGVGVAGERQQQTVTYSTKLTQQMIGQNGGQLPPPPPHNQPPPTHSQPPTTQQQQQQMQQQNQSAQYGMIPMRQN